MSRSPLPVWVVDWRVAAATLERLGDAAAVARRLQGGVGVVIVSDETVDVQALIAHGADEVVLVRVSGSGQRTIAAGWRRALADASPRLVLAPGDVTGRECASLLAADAGWSFLGAALLLNARGDSIEVTTLDRTGRMSRRVTVAEGETAVATMRPGVAEAMASEASRTGTVRHIDVEPCDEAVRVERDIPADPATVDIRFAERLVSGGRGLGGKEGFDVLRRIAGRLNAGVAASRMAVDLGWIEHARQVGQTGKTVKPALYIACGISGASHHLDGMSEARHIVAINTDAQAPIFKTTHLGLVADLHDVLARVEEGLKQ